jgi:membrane-associated phospholipid phosphatase
MRVKLIVAIVAAIGLAWLATEVIAGNTLPFDLDVRNAIHAHATSAITAAMMFWSFIGEAYVLLPLTFLIAAALWRLGRKDRAIMFAIAMAGAKTIESALKLTIHRGRPESFFNYPALASYSFPSGHALVSTVFFGILAAFISSRLRATWKKAVVWAAAILMIAGIGVSRVYLGVHFPTDVIGGYAAGVAWMLLVVRI